MPVKPPADRAARPTGGAKPVLALAVVLAAVVTVVAVLGFGTSSGGSTEDPCAGATVGGAALLIDLRKPMRDAAAGSVFRDIARRLDAGATLRVFTITDDRVAPRRFVGQLCRPYDGLDVISAKDKSAAARDCDDLPAQIPPDLRDSATNYCAERAALERRIDAMAADSENRDVVADAYLMEALEETVTELADDAGSNTLFVLSDMLQHASWYSHLDLDWTAWNFGDFDLVRAAREPASRAGRPADLGVRVLHLPRLGLTDGWRAKDALQTFWRRYFEGADVAFEDRAPLPGYDAATLMDLDGDARAAAQERDALARARGESERRLREIEDERRALAARERDAAEATDRKREEVAELRRTRLALVAERARVRERMDAMPTAPRTPAAAIQPPDDAPPPALCGLSLQPAFQARLADERYLGDRRTNYGAGTIAVRYAVTAQGLTLDDAVVVQREQSTATRNEHFDTLAADASEQVRNWQFTVDCGADGAIGTQGQPGVATFRYQEKCSGAPLPRCRTVLFDVALSSGDPSSASAGAG